MDKSGHDSAKIVSAHGFLECDPGRYQKAAKIRGQVHKFYWVRAAILAASPMSARKMISTAPLAPITAICAVGQA